jgi:hypothetical protein
MLGFFFPKTTTGITSQLVLLEPVVLVGPELGPGPELELELEPLPPSSLAPQVSFLALTDSQLM